MHSYLLCALSPTVAAIYVAIYSAIYCMHDITVM